MQAAERITLQKIRATFYFSKKFSKIIESADSSSFHNIFGDYWSDKNHLYYFGKIVENADPATAEVVHRPDNGRETAYLKDDRSVFYEGHRFEADSKSFLSIAEPFRADLCGDAKDKNHCYVEGKVQKEKDK